MLRNKFKKSEEHQGIHNILIKHQMNIKRFYLGTAVSFLFNSNTEIIETKMLFCYMRRNKI